MLRDYAGAMRRLPEIFGTIAFRKRTLEDLLNDASRGGRAYSNHAQSAPA